MCWKYLLDHINEIFPFNIKRRGNYKDNKQHKYLITKIPNSKMHLLLLGTQAFNSFYSFRNTSNIYVLRIHNQQFK